MGSGTGMSRGKWSSALGGVASLLLLVTMAGPAQAETVRSQQWYLDAMHAEEMWRTSTGAGVTVAVIDSGVNPELPDLRGQVLPGKDFSGVAGDERSDYMGHGTTMAVTIAGTGKAFGGGGAFGLAPGAKILPLRVVNDRAPKIKANAEVSLVRAVRFAADSDARVINISMGGPGLSPELESAVQYAISKGKLIFAAAGNDGKRHSEVDFPAAFPGVVAVAALDRESKATEESSRGPQVSLAAPGDDMVTTCQGGTGVCRGHGTSDATALASASAALVWSVHPDWTSNQILRVLINTAGGPHSGEKRTDSVGYGGVRPRIALKTPGDPGPADISPLTGKPASGSAASRSSQPSQKKGAGIQRSKQPVPDIAKQASGGDNTIKWVALGLGATALISLAIAVPTVIAHRRRSRPGVFGPPPPSHDRYNDSAHH